MKKDIMGLARIGEETVRKRLDMCLWAINPSIYCGETASEESIEAYRKFFPEIVSRYRTMRDTAIEQGLDIADQDATLLTLLPEINDVLSIPITFREVVAGMKIEGIKLPGI